MNEIFKFIWAHKYVLAELVLLIIVTLITIFKKKVKISDVFTQVLLVLPEFIVLAEHQFSDGPSKYSFVFNKCVELLMNLTHLKQEEVIDKYTVSIDCAIENVLSTPQKKVR